jgi:hypothetical protein
MPRTDIIRNRNGQPTEEPKNAVDVKLDRVNELWMTLERKLLKEQPPRRIACGYRELCDEHGDVVEEHYIGIQRHHGRWRICHAVAPSTSDESNLPWKPITECDVETRVEATKAIDKLKVQVEETGKYFIPALDKAIDRLEKSLLYDQD